MLTYEMILSRTPRKTASVDIPQYLAKDVGIGPHFPRDVPGFTPLRRRGIRAWLGLRRLASLRHMA